MKESSALVGGIMQTEDKPQVASARAGSKSSLSRRRFEVSIGDQVDEDFEFSGALRRRISQVVAMAGLLAFILVDYLGDASIGPSWLDWKIIAMTLPAVLLPMAMSFRRVRRGLLWQYLLVAMFVFGLTLATVIDIGRNQDSWLHYESLLLITLYVYLLSTLSLFRAIFCGLCTWVAFSVTQFQHRGAGEVDLGVYYLLAANLAGAFCLFYLERSAKARYSDEVHMRLRSMLDSLTGVLNRGAATDHLERIWGHARREGKLIALMMIDIDHFKAINDKLGHLAGDRALTHVADVLTQTARRPLDAIGRFGGDEFIAMWYDPDARWFDGMLAGLQARIAAIEGMGANAPLALSISGGALMLRPEREQEFSEFMGELDERLQAAKRQGRKTISYKNLGAAVQLVN